MCNQYDFFIIFLQYKNIVIIYLNNLISEKRICSFFEMCQSIEKLNRVIKAITAGRARPVDRRTLSIQTPNRSAPAMAPAPLMTPTMAPVCRDELIKLRVENKKLNNLLKKACEINKKHIGRILLLQYKFKEERKRNYKKMELIALLKRELNRRSIRCQPTADNGRIDRMRSLIRRQLLKRILMRTL